MKQNVNGDMHHSQNHSWIQHLPGTKRGLFPTYWYDLIPVLVVRPGGEGHFDPPPCHTEECITSWLAWHFSRNIGIEKEDEIRSRRNRVVASLCLSCGWLLAVDGCSRAKPAPVMAAPEVEVASVSSGISRSMENGSDAGRNGQRRDQRRRSAAIC